MAPVAPSRGLGKANWFGCGNNLVTPNLVELGKKRGKKKEKVSVRSNCGGLNLRACSFAGPSSE